MSPMHEKQTNKHVLSNCGSLAVLERYIHRHDNVLRILAAWIKSTLRIKSAHSTSDLLSVDYLPLSNNFVYKRPDIAIVGRSSIATFRTNMTLTVC